ncbi:MAG: hypothetical protein U9N14_02105 [Pseudomonadota bacterium]|nr:hypothetical protein [Pseudomonadota bacterium]
MHVPAPLRRFGASIETMARADAPAFANRTDGHLPVWLWLWFPLVLMVAIIASRYVGDDAFACMLKKESSFGEHMTSVLFLASAVMAGILACDTTAFGNHWVRTGFFIVVFGSVFVAGEELSWGQHMFGWETPDWVKAVNKQDETNLHNIFERALDQKLRGISSIVIFVICGITPLLIRAGKLAWLERFPPVRWLIPSMALVPVSWLVISPRIIDRVQVWFDVTFPFPLDIPTREFQEIQEMYISLFVFLYLLDALRRRRPLDAGGKNA